MGGFGSNVVASPQRQMRLMSLKKTGLGTPVISGSCSNMCSVVDNGTGDYQIVFDIPFNQIPEVMAQSTTDDRITRVGTCTITGVQILTENLSGSAAEGDCHILIVGSDARDLIS